MSEENKPLVIDFGSGTIKAGFSGDKDIRVEFPSIIGKPKHKNDKSLHKDFFVGDDAIKLKDKLSLRNLNERGYISNWDDFEKALHHTLYNELRVSPEDQPLLLTGIGGGLNGQKDREKITQIIFETINIPHFLIRLPAVLSLLVQGENTGIVLDSGETVTHAVPVLNGKVLEDCTTVLPLGN
jgi:actin